MKIQPQKTCLFYLTLLAQLICYSVNAEESTQTIRYDDKWTVIHKDNGSTRFEYNINQTSLFYELRLTGVELGGELKSFSTPEITRNNGRVIKQWTPYLQEIWSDNHDKNIVIQVNKSTNLSFDNQDIKLLYEVNSNFHDALTVGSHPFSLLFHDFKKSTQSQPFINPSINISPSHCHNLNNFLPISKGEGEIILELNKQSLPIHLQTFFSLKPASNSPLVSSYPAVFSQDNGNTQLAIHQEINTRSEPLKHQIKVMSDDTITWRQQIIKDWPVTEHCENTANNFGGSLAIEGDWLIISDSHDCEDNMFSGALFVFHKEDNNWRFHSKLKSKETYREGSFGGQVSIQDGVIYTSSNNNYLQQIHLFKLIDNHWQEQPGIMINGRSQANGSMSEFKVTDQLLVIGMQGFLDPQYFTQLSAGEVLVYRNTKGQWQLETSLKPKIGQGDDEFGYSIAVNNNVIAVAAPNLPANKKNQAKGAVHLFEYDSGQWKTTQLIRPGINNLAVNVKREGFAIGLEMGSTGLFIEDFDLVYPSGKINDLPNVCVFADRRSAIHHYQKQGDKWQFIQSIKPESNSGYLPDSLNANKTGLYFITTEPKGLNQKNLSINHYQNGKTKSNLILNSK